MGKERTRTRMTSAEAMLYSESDHEGSAATRQDPSAPAPAVAQSSAVPSRRPSIAFQDEVLSSVQRRVSALLEDTPQQAPANNGQNGSSSAVRAPSAPAAPSTAELEAMSDGELIEYFASTPLPEGFTMPPLSAHGYSLAAMVRALPRLIEEHQRERGARARAGQLRRGPSLGSSGSGTGGVGGAVGGTVSGAEEYYWSEDVHGTGNGGDSNSSGDVGSKRARGAEEAAAREAAKWARRQAKMKGSRA